MIKKVQFRYDWWTAVFELEDSEETRKHIMEVVISNRTVKLKNYIDFEKEYLLMLSDQILYFASQLSVDTKKVRIKEIIRLVHDMDTFIIDGSTGIKVVSVDIWAFDKKGIEIINPYFSDQAPL